MTVHPFTPRPHLLRLPLDRGVAHLRSPAMQRDLERLAAEDAAVALKDAATSVEGEP